MASLDFKQTDAKDAPAGTFPIEVSSEYRVHLSEAAHKSMMQHATTTNEVELCGVLVGEAKRDAAGNFLLIHATIEGRHANNYGAQVTFTHQTWEYINGIKDKQHPKLRIVGWYHTHPGFGVFLSKMDMFIQENFFNLPFQVAIVLETKKDQEGCFAWQDGRCEPLRRYWVGSRETKLATGGVEGAEDFAPQSRSVSTPPGGAPARRTSEPFPWSPWSLLLVAAVFVSGLVLGRTLMVPALRQTLVESLESELYSSLEFAGLNALAAQDFGELKTRVSDASARLRRNDTAGSSQVLKETEARIAELEQVYQKRRQALRSDLTRLMSHKQSLSTQIDLVTQRQDRLETLVGMIELSQLEAVLQKDGRPLDLSGLRPAERDELRRRVESVIRRVPEARDALARIHPGVMDIVSAGAGPAGGAPQNR